MDFRILGPLELAVGDRAVHLRGARQRALLGVLLVSANRVLSADRLIEDVWGDRPPASGPAALQMRISQLRRALSGLAQPPQDHANLLATEPSGYVLRVGPEDVDANRFERLLAEGRTLAADGDAAAASACLHSAVSLWRGPALADFTFEPFAQSEIARLEELRLASVEECVEVDLALGRHDVLVAELESSVAAHPLRERLRGQLMVALYRSGRQADALAAYRDTRRYLADELGMEPGPALRRLHDQVLRQAADLELPGPGGAPRPAARHGGAPRPAAPEPVPAAATRKPITVACTVLRVEAERTGALDPERRSRALARCLAVSGHTFEQQGAQVHRLPGAVLAAFGVPVVHEDDGLRAVRATVTVHERVGALAAELEREHAVRVRARSGVATGDVLAGDGADEEMLATQEPADTALALSALAETDEVLIADTTEPLVRHAAVLTRRVVSPSSSAWRVASVSADHGARAMRRDSPLVGRLTELTALATLLDRATTEGSVGTCTVVGPAGVGKSRLVQEFTESVGRNATVVRGACTPYGEIATFWPLRQVVEQLAAGRPLVDVMGDAEHARLVAELVAAAVGMGTAQDGGDVFWAVGRFLEAQSRARPLVVVLEDMHWASPTMLALVEFLAGWPRPAPVVLLCLARPELLQEHPGWRDLPRSGCIEVPPLDPHESDTMLRHLAGPLTITAEARGRISSAAEGNPLFLEQLLAMLTEHPGLDVETELPPTIAALLAARLDRLGPGERAVLERAAVAGRAFHRDAISALLPPAARPTVERHLVALVSRDLLEVHPGHDIGPTHRFRHGLIHAAAYRSATTGTHADLHESLATWLDRSGDAADEVVGHHLERAFSCRTALGIRDDHTRLLARRAARRLRRAGEHAHGRGDMPAAAALLDRARRLPTADDATALEVLPGLGYALFEVGQLQRAEEILLDAVERAAAADDQRVRWQALVTLMHVQMYLKPEVVRPDALAGPAAEAVGTLERLGDDVGLARALMFSSELQWALGRSVATKDAAERGLVVARRSHSRREEAWCRGQLGFALLNGPVPVGEGLRRCRDMLDETRGDPVAEANLLLFVAVHEAMHGEFAAARDHASAGRAGTRELGLRWQTGIHALLSSYVALLSGDPVEAERLTRSALEDFQEAGDRWDVATAEVDLPRALYEQGRYDEARTAVARSGGRPLADVEWNIKRCGVPALLLAREGRFAPAVALAREGIAVAATTDFLGWQADARMDLGEVLELAGRRGAAADALRGALRLYARKEHQVGAARARARLDSLAPRRRKAARAGA